MSRCPPVTKHGGVANAIVDSEVLVGHRARLRAWLLAESGLPARADDEPVDIETAMAEEQELQRALWDADFGRAGWPVEVGGLGGDALLRAATYEELALAGFRIPQPSYTMETLSPALIAFAPALAAEVLAPALRGDEIWCQGFSEPEAGSDLAALSCRATPVDGGFAVSGQKTWSSFGHLSRRSAVLVRTGEPGHRGITMVLADLDRPGVTVRPIRLNGGRNELAELYFDDHLVPADRTVGPVGAGWKVAMYLLQWERGMYAWQRQAVMRARLVAAATDGGGGSLGSAFVRAWTLVHALRSRAAGTVRRLAAGGNPGPEISVDKVLLSRTEQAVMDALRLAEPERFAFGRSAKDELVRSEWFYSRAATIYGGSVDIQKGIVAERVLGLPRGAR